MAQPAGAKQLVRRDAFVDETDPHIPDSQPPAAIFKLVRVGDDRGVTARFEVFATDFQLGLSRGLLRCDYRYVRAIASTPFAVAAEKRIENTWSDLYAPQWAPAGEFPNDIHL